MTNLHPASKAAAKILKSQGFDFIRTSALSFSICGKDFNKLYVDIRCSKDTDNLARFEVSSIYDNSENYAKAAVLNNQTFGY